MTCGRALQKEQGGSSLTMTSEWGVILLQQGGSKNTRWFIHLQLFLLKLIKVPPPNNNSNNHGDHSMTWRPYGRR